MYGVKNLYEEIQEIDVADDLTKYPVREQIDKLIEYKEQGWSPNLPFLDNYFYEVFKYNMNIITKYITLYYIYDNIKLFEELKFNADKLFKNKLITGIHYTIIYHIIMYNVVDVRLRLRSNYNVNQYIKQLLPNNSNNITVFYQIIISLWNYHLSMVNLP